MTDSLDRIDPAWDAARDLMTGRAAPGPPQPGASLLERQRAIVAMGRRAIAPPELPVLMQDAAALLADVLGAPYSLVAELTSDSRPESLQLTLRKSGGTGPDAVIYQAETTGGDSLVGYVLQVAHPVVVADLSAEKRLGDRLLRRHGIRSALAVPLRLQDRSFGALAACSDHPHAFDDEDLLFAETIAHLVTTTIGRTRAEKSLADERRLANGVLQTVDALVLVLDGRGQIVTINQACQRLTGFAPEEARGRYFWNVFCVAKQVDFCRRHLEELRERKSPVEYESLLLTKHSQQRQIAWACSAILAADGSLESIIATGVDITEQRRAQEEAERAVRVAEQARQVVARALFAAERAGAHPFPDRAADFFPADGPQPAGRAGQLAPLTPAERRRHPRRSFPYKQRIAAVVDGKLPDRQTFVDVQCRDVAASGFSFLSPTPPASDTLVVALGIPPSVTYLVAQVVHVTRVQKHGELKYLIGCTYVGRAAY
jgi:PAS domain S-box-containing protein